MNKDTIIAALKLSPHTIIFKKMDGTIRKMRCTLDPFSVKDQPEQRVPENVIAWDLDADDWRQFRASNVQTMIGDCNSVDAIKKDIQSRVYKTWIMLVNKEADRLSKAYDDFNRVMTSMDDDVLNYIIFWNNGFSGASECDVAHMARRELAARGKPYNDELSSALNELLEDYH